MLIIGSILLLLANAVALRREKPTLFNRVAILILLYSNTRIGVFSGLFHSTKIIGFLHLVYYKNDRILVKWLGLTELLSIKEWVSFAPLSSVAITFMQSVSYAFLFLLFSKFLLSTGFILILSSLLVEFASLLPPLTLC